MFLNKVLISLAVAGSFQGASSTPITGPSEGALLVRDDQASDPSSLESDPGARRPPLFFYDPLHMSDISHLVIPQGDDVCNMLLSVKRIVKKTDTAEQVETSVFAFPACNDLPEAKLGHLEWDSSQIYNATSIDELSYGELFLLEGIEMKNKGDKEDKAGFVYGKAPIRKLQAKTENLAEGGNGADIVTGWELVDYTESLDFDYKKQRGNLLGPYPNPYRLNFGEAIPEGTDLSELHMPLINGAGTGLPAMWLYQAP